MAATSPQRGTDDADAATAPPGTPTTGAVVHDTRRWSRDGAAGPAAPAVPAVPAPRAPARPADDRDGNVLDAGPLLRIGTMIRKVLEEVRDTPLDDRARERVRELRNRAIEELATHLGPELREELAALDVPLPADEVPSDVELRIAQAQLVGWLEGLFQGAQMAFAAEQMAARSQLERLRTEAAQQRDLPPGSGNQYL